MDTRDGPASMERVKKDNGVGIDPIIFKVNEEETLRKGKNLIKTCSSNLQILSWPYTIGSYKPL